MNQKEPIPPDLFIIPMDSPPGLLLRLATRRDLRPLHMAFYSNQSLTQFRTQFERAIERQHSGRCYWLIAESETKIVGSGQLIIYPHGAELANIYVLEDHQNQGIGTAIIHVLTTIARWAELTSLEIGVTVSNNRALALYQRLGFEEDRQLRFASDEPAIILRKELQI